jgi:hypothetical protein
MTATVLAISVAYVVMGLLLLTLGLSARVAWWIKAGAIVVTSVFFVEVFFATKSLLGWAGSSALPPRFQLLWTRVVEPDAKDSDPGAIYLWVEQVDENNVPSGRPRAYRLPYTKPLAERSLKARDEIMSGNPQEGTSEDLTENETPQTPGGKLDPSMQANRNDTGLANLDLDQLRLLEQAEHLEFRPMTGPLLPPKGP